MQQLSPGLPLQRTPRDQGTSATTSQCCLSNPLRTLPSSTVRAVFVNQQSDCSALSSSASSASRSRQIFNIPRRSHTRNQSTSAAPQDSLSVKNPSLNTNCDLPLGDSSAATIHLRRSCECDNHKSGDEDDSDVMTQPFRDECIRVARAFFGTGSDKELSIDGKTRDLLLRNLSQTSHPDVVSFLFTARRN